MDRYDRHTTCITLEGSEMRCDGPLSLSLYLYISQPSGLTDADAEEGMQIVCVHDDVCVISLSSHSNLSLIHI